MKGRNRRKDGQDILSVEKLGVERRGNSSLFSKQVFSLIRISSFLLMCAFLFLNIILSILLEQT